MIRFLAAWCAIVLLAPNFAAAPADPAPAKEEGKEERNGTSALMKSISWRRGPWQAEIGKFATIKVPEGFMFTAGEGTRKLLEAMGNPTSGSELGFLSPTNLDWFVVFRFQDVGYVKDDDKDKLDATKLLTTIKKGTEESNKMREKMGAAPMRIVGWEVTPKYNEQTHNLEWAIRGESEGRPVINYNTRLLGREGVMEAKLVTDPELLATNLVTFQGLLTGYSYKGGHTYAEYRQGDKLAKYGLAALITGGAAAVAVKTGLLSAIILFFKKGIKLIVVGLAAIGAWIKRLVQGRGRREDISSQ